MLGFGSQPFLSSFLLKQKRCRRSGQQTQAGSPYEKQECRISWNAWTQSPKDTLRTPFGDFQIAKHAHTQIWLTAHSEEPTSLLTIIKSIRLNKQKEAGMITCSSERFLLKGSSWGGGIRHIWKHFLFSKSGLTLLKYLAVLQIHKLTHVSQQAEKPPGTLGFGHITICFEL